MVTDWDFSFRKAIGDAVRKHRKSLGLKQEQLGFRSGVSRKSVSNLEKGERCTIENLRRLCFGLSVPVWKIVHEAETTAPGDSL